MKRKIFALALLTASISFTACGGDDDTEEPENTCETCELDLLGTPISQEICDNGDGTVTITIDGTSQTSDLNGVTFAQFITGLESAGATCN